MDFSSIMNSNLVSALLGTFVGGLITWWVTSSSLKKQFDKEQKIRKREDIKRLIVALVSIKNEVKSNINNVDEFTRSMVNCTISLKSNLFSFDRYREYRDIIEVENGNELIEKILEVNSTMENLYKISSLKKEDVSVAIEGGKEIQRKLEEQIKIQRLLLKQNS